MRANRFKQRLAAGERQLGLWSGIVHPVVMEVLASAGADWVLLDMEHGTAEVHDVLVAAQAAAAWPVEVAVRVAACDATLIKRVLDCGVRTIFVPQVGSAEQAVQAVRAARYPPGGIRGLSRSTRASTYGRDPEALRRANADVAIVVQIETREGLAAVDAIAAVDGVDALFVGPADLSASLGHLGELEHADVEAAAQRILAAAQRRGRGAGIFALDPLSAARYLEGGFRFAAVAQDVALLVRGAEATLSSLRGMPR